MLIELHILQNFAPSNLNRDDTGSPKDCEFGGFRRARISSQCFKRAMRQAFKDDKLLAPDDLAERTKRLVEELTGRFEQAGKDRDQANAVARAALNAAGLKVETNEKTQYLLFLGRREIGAMADLCLDRWDALLPAADDQASTDGAQAVAAKGGKKAKTTPVDPDLAKAMLKLLNGGRAADLALFGRMIADLPERNVDGSCQVAHALSTNTVNVEFDFYTAVDDLRPEDTAGADMLGTIEFNSACYYRYANVDVRQLAVNLGGDLDLTRRTVEAFLRAAITAVPSGKQNSMAAQNPPSLVFVVAREAGMWSLANAFVRPVHPKQQDDLVALSIQRLDRHWGDVARMYGERQIVGKWVCMLDAGLPDDASLPDDAALPGSQLARLGKFAVEGVDTLIDQALQAVASGSGAVAV